MDLTSNHTSSSTSQNTTHQQAWNSDANYSSTSEVAHGVEMTNTTNHLTDSGTILTANTSRESSPNHYYSLAEDPLSEETLLALGIDINEIRAQRQIEHRLKQEAEQLEFAKRLQMVYNLELSDGSSSASTSTTSARDTYILPSPVSVAIPIDITQRDRDAVINGARSVQTDVISLNGRIFDSNSNSTSSSSSSSGSNTNDNNNTDQQNNKRKMNHPPSSGNAIVIPSSSTTITVGSPTSPTTRQNGKRPRHWPPTHENLPCIDIGSDSDSDSDSYSDLLPLPPNPITRTIALVPSSSAATPLPRIAKKKPTTEIQNNVISDWKSSLEDDSYTITTPIETSSDLKVDLMDHQKAGYHWMCQQEESDINGGLLADDVGLGKTIQTLALITGRRYAGDPPSPRPTSGGRIACQTPFKVKSNLVICPTSLMAQWTKEITSKTENVSVYLHHGPKRLVDPYKVAEFDVIITSYGALKNEFPPSVFNSVGGVLNALIFHRVILDEAHIIKNTSTVAARACKIIKSTYRWCLTATPIQSKIADLHSLLNFLKVEPYCNQAKFMINNFSAGGNEKEIILSLLKSTCLRRSKKVLTLPAKKEHMVRADFSEPEQLAYNLLRAQVNKDLKYYITPFRVLRNYTYVLGLLTSLRQSCLHPNMGYSSSIKTQNQTSVHTENANRIDSAIVGRLGYLKEGYQTIECPICMDTADDPLIISKCGHILCSECMHAYVNATNLISKTCPECRGPLDINHAVPVSVFLKVRLLVTPQDQGQQLTSMTNSTKINMMLDIVKKVNDQSNGTDKTIIFSQYTRMLQHMNDGLKENGYNCGMFDCSVSIAKRADILRQFGDDPTMKVLLMSTKTGAVGLNLTMANQVIMVDVGWNSAMEDQAVGRVHRLGQTKPVHIHRLFINNTLEDRVFELHEQRKQATTSAFNGQSSKPDRLGSSEIEYLINGGISPFNTAVAAPST